jgi:hypothetical protein
MIRTRNVDIVSPLRYKEIHFHDLLPALTGTLAGVMLGAWPYSSKVPFGQGTVLPGTSGKIVDVLLHQSTVGTAGTSWTANVKKNGTTIFATNGVLALASGANVAVDSRGEISLPTGATRPVLTSTLANLLLKKGDVLSWDLTVSGTYTGTAPFIGIVVVIDPVNA